MFAGTIVYLRLQVFWQIAFAAFGFLGWRHSLSVCLLLPVDHPHCCSVNTCTGLGPRCQIACSLLLWRCACSGRCVSLDGAGYVSDGGDTRRSLDTSRHHLTHAVVRWFFCAPPDLSPAPFCLGFAQRLEAAKRKQDRASNGNADNANNNGSDDAMDDEEEESELDEDELEARKAAEYFEDGDAPAGSDAAGATGGGGNSADGGGGGVPFQQLNISRPLLRAVEAMGYVNPTPVQQRAVPFALAGRCGAVASGFV